MIYRNDNEFKRILDKYKYSEKKSKDYMFYQNKAYNYLLEYEKLLKEKKYLTADVMQLIDIAIFPFIRQFYNVDKEYFISNFPYFYKWLNTLIESNFPESLPQVDSLSSSTGFYGLFSGYKKKIIEVAREYNIEEIKLVKRLGELDIIAGQEDQIISIAAEISKNGQKL